MFVGFDDDSLIIPYRGVNNYVLLKRSLKNLVDKLLVNRARKGGPLTKPRSGHELSVGFKPTNSFFPFSIFSSNIFLPFFL